jgi:hypothetical protein
MRSTALAMSASSSGLAVGVHRQHRHRHREQDFTRLRMHRGSIDAGDAHWNVAWRPDAQRGEIPRRTKVPE